MNKPLTEEELIAAAEEFAPKDFSPTTADEIDWVLGKIADARSKAARIRENADKIACDAEREASFFEWKYGTLLMAFAKQQIAAEGGKRKSIRLFNGSLGWRTTPARMVLAEGEAAEAQAIAWAKQHMPEAVCQVEKLDRMLLKDQVAECGNAVVAVSTGEHLDWATVVPAEERFFIK